jgi:predicted permease
MEIHLRIVTSIAILLALIGLAMALRRAGVLEERHSTLFSRLVTGVTLPALVFASLARTRLSLVDGELALAMCGRDRQQ